MLKMEFVVHSEKYVVDEFLFVIIDIVSLHYHLDTYIVPFIYASFYGVYYSL